MVRPRSPLVNALGNSNRAWRPRAALCAKSASFGRKQERRLGEAQASRDQQLGEERVACAVAVSGAGPLGAVDVEAAQSYITKHAVIFKGHEADVGSLGGAFVGIVPRSNTGPPVAISPPPDLAMGERTGPDQAFQLRPSVSFSNAATLRFQDAAEMRAPASSRRRTRWNASTSPRVAAQTDLPQAACRKRTHTAMS